MKLVMTLTIENASNDDLMEFCKQLKDDGYSDVAVHNFIAGQPLARREPDPKSPRVAMFNYRLVQE